MRTQKPTFAPYGPELIKCDEVKALAYLLEVRPVEAAGYVALVVAMGIAEADDFGLIDHLTDKTIEAACAWDGERGALVNAMCAAGVLSGERDSDTRPLRIASGLWDAMAGAVVRKRQASRERMAAMRGRKNDS